MQKWFFNVFLLSLFVCIFLSHFMRGIWLRDWIPDILVGIVVLSLLAWFVSSFSRVIEWIKKRDAQFIVSTGFWCIGVLVILAMLNWLSVKKNIKADLTRNKIHSLSQQSANIVKNLKEPVQIELWSKDVNTVAGNFDVRSFLENYEIKSGAKLKVIYYHPDKEPVLVEQRGITRDNIFIIRSESGREARVENFTESNFEEQITSAIVKATKGVKKTVCFLTGHKEFSLSDSEAAGLSDLKAALEKASYATKEILLASDVTALKDCSLLTIVGPTTAPSADEIDAINDYTFEGGALMAMFGYGVPKEWRKILSKFEVYPREDLVLDRRSAANVFVQEYPEDIDFVASFTLPTVFRLASSIYTPTVPSNEDLSIKTFLTSDADFTFSKTGKMKTVVPEQKAGDKQGPFALGVWVEEKTLEKVTGEEVIKDESSFIDIFDNRVFAQNLEVKNKKTLKKLKKKASSLILFGNHLFAINGNIRQYGNEDLLLNSISFLLKDNELVGVRAKPFKQASLSLNRDNIYQVRGYLLLAAFVFIFLGVWATRRRRITV